MKRLGIVVMAAILLFMNIGLSSSDAATAEPIKFTLNGKALIFKIPPLSLNGKTYVEVRSLFNQLGYTVFYNTNIWGDREVQASSTGRKIVIKVDEEKAIIDKNPDPIKTDIEVINGRVMVGLRFVGVLTAKALHGTLAKRTVEMTDNWPNKQEEAAIYSVLDQLYDAEESNDADAYMSLFHPASPNREINGVKVHEEFAKTTTKIGRGEKTIKS